MCVCVCVVVISRFDGAGLDRPGHSLWGGCLPAAGMSERLAALAAAAARRD